MKQEINEIITRVLDGSATSDDYKHLTGWVKQNSENEKEFANYESLWLALDIIANKEKFSLEQGYKKIIRKQNQKVNSKNVRTILLHRWKIAASILIVVGISSLAFWIGKQHNNSSAISFYELSTPKGSKSQLVLPDGTKILLNAGSKLRYPNKFRNNLREVYLEGEGYFDVTKDAKRPFIVHTSDINIRVLGTVFNVKSYPNEGTIEATLISGKVLIESKLKNADKIAQLLPNQKVTFLKKTGKILLNDNEQEQMDKIIAGKERDNQSGKIIFTEKVNTAIYTAWKDNLLVFDNETFESIALKLERRYGAIIRFDDNEMKNYRFSGTFPEISIDRALNALQFASPFHYKIKGDSIYIRN
jgi:ferric-dicitrate binding protein FerR (iron transport regulator)